MSRIKQARRRRYNVKAGVTVTLVFRSLSGELVKGEIKDISQTGVYAEIENNVADIPVAENQILPEGKITWNENEWAFGRSAVKFVKRTDGKTSVGLMFVDNMAPLDGKLSKVLEITLDAQMRDSDLEIDIAGASLGDFLAIDLGAQDIFSKARRYQAYLSSLERSDRWGYWIPRKASKGSRVHLKQTRSDGRDDFILMSSNDYLGLASHPAVVDAAKNALDRYGFGSTGSAVTCGQTEEHEALEDTLARMFRTEGALLFNSGYAANIGMISGIVGPSDLVVADVLSHASIFDGMQMSQGIKRFFKHNDVKHLAKVLERTRSEASGCLIAAEGVFSMDGDTAPLAEIVKLARKYEARVMIDEAHSFGVLGQTGLGLAEESGLMGGIDLTMGTFSKICGGIGGFAAGSREIIDWLRISARSAFFSVSVPPSTAAAARTALDIFQTQPQLVQKLRENIRMFTDGLRNMGFNIPTDHRTPIVPVIIGDEKKLGQIYKILIDAGIYTIPVVYPAVSRNSCRFRFTVTANHSISDIDYALVVLSRALEKVGLDAKTTSYGQDAA